MAEKPKTSVELPAESDTRAEPVAAGVTVDFPVPKKRRAGRRPDAEDTGAIGPFLRAGTNSTTHGKRAKIFLWGPTGTYKTRTALTFPAPIVIDLERGTVAYENEFAFHVYHTTDPDEVANAVDYLLKNDHPFRTLVIDPITVYWDALQRKWSDIFLRRNRGGKGFKHEFYTMQPSDWGTVKGEHRALVRKVLSLDMNVVVTAHMKPLYSDDGSGNFMKRIGDTFGAERDFPYLFDVVVHATKAEDGSGVGLVEKARYRLPEQISLGAYSAFEDAFGRESLERPAERPRPSTPAQHGAIEKLLEKLGITQDQAEARYEAYGASSIDELTYESAGTILSRLEETITKRGL